MFAAVTDMEPGMVFRSFQGGPLLRWRGVEPVVSRFAGKRRVRVLVTPGPAFVVDAREKFAVVAR